MKYFTYCEYYSFLDLYSYKTIPHTNTPDAGVMKDGTKDDRLSELTIIKITRKICIRLNTPYSLPHSPIVKLTVSDIK